MSEPVRAGGLRKASPYFAALALVPAVFHYGGSSELASTPPAMRAAGDRLKVLPGEDLDLRLRSYQAIFASLNVAAQVDVDEVFEAKPIQTVRHRAKVRRITGKRELVETQADYEHLL